MNNLILNRDFRLPEDGWYQIAPLGEFPHAGAGVVQVIDAEACVAMAARFAADANVPNFAGLLIDFDHFSLDVGQRSEAAGWIVGLEARQEGRGSGVESPASFHDGTTPRQSPAGAGLWAQIRWSDVGEAAVKGGRYRFLSPVWTRADCVDLGVDGGTGSAGSPQAGWPRVRPVRLINAAVTNDPNLKGMVPLSNTGRGGVDSVSLNRGEQRKGDRSMKSVIEKLVNHLGLAADATEAAILEKMAGLPALTVVTELQNSLRQAQGERDALQTALNSANDELVNRHLAEFEGVISNESREFWAGQLMENREGALAALKDIQKGMSGRGAGEAARAESTTRKPLHNRATARPVPPGQGGGGDGESKAVKIRNRAHEIAKAEGVAFSVAFRRAEREVIG